MTEKILDAMFLFLVLEASWIDLHKREIPDRIPAEMVILGIVAVWTVDSITLSERLTGLFCISLPMIALANIWPGAFGGGDIKLAAAGGVFLGARRAFAAGAVSILAGGIILGVLLFKKKVKRKDEVPFVPFLGMGMVLGLLQGFEMAAWYIGQ